MTHVSLITRMSDIFYFSVIRAISVKINLYFLTRASFLRNPRRTFANFSAFAFAYLNIFCGFWLCSGMVDISPYYGRNCWKPLIFYGCFFAGPDFLTKQTVFEQKSGINWQKLKMWFFTQNKNLHQFPGMKNKNLCPFYFTGL